MDPDAYPDPAIVAIDLQDANKKLIKKKKFCLLPTFELWRYIYIIFQTKNVQKMSQNSKTQGFS